jgi:hypothetical protein
MKPRVQWLRGRAVHQRRRPLKESAMNPNSMMYANDPNYTAMFFVIAAYVALMAAFLAQF